MTSTRLLTSREVAELLRVHPKHVYRLLKGGLPARRVGGEWRFSSEEVLAWSATRGLRGAAEPSVKPAQSNSVDPDKPPPLLAANGDVVVDMLLSRLRDPIVGLVHADRDTALAHLQARRVVLAGSHGELDRRAAASPTEDARVFVHLVERAVGLCYRRAQSKPRLEDLAGLRLASRPRSAGVRLHLDAAMRKVGLDPRQIAAHSIELASHAEVVLAVLRKDADVGLASQAWAQRAGLAFRELQIESYGLVVRARDLGVVPVLHLCELAQRAEVRTALQSTPGYDASRCGEVSFGVN